MNINLEEITFEWAHGSSIDHDHVLPLSGNWKYFRESLEGHKPENQWANYIAGPFSNFGGQVGTGLGPRRSERCALGMVRQYLPFVLARPRASEIAQGYVEVSDALFSAVTEYFDRYEGVYFEGFSSYAGSRQASFILPVSRPIDGDESTALGDAITEAIGIPGLLWDRCVYKLHEPLFLPRAGVEVITLGMLGEPQLLNVDQVLKQNGPIQTHRPVKKVN